MAQVNEELLNKLEFFREERKPMTGPGKEVVISTKHKGVYRQYQYYDDGTASEEEMKLLETQIRGILTHAIERGLKQNNISL